MAEMERREQEPVMNDLGLDEEDEMAEMPTDEEIAQMFEQDESTDDPEVPADQEDPGNIFPFPPVPDQIPDNRIAVEAFCPHCHNPVFIDVPDGTTPDKCEAEAGKVCKCVGAKLARQGSTLGKKIDALFGSESGIKFGFVDVHTPAEIEIIKTVGLLVAERKIKGVVVTLENGDKATILVVKDNTKVRRNKATKAEMEA